MLNFIFGSFLSSRNIFLTMMFKLLGGLLLLTGCNMGIYFLFQFLVPIVGYFESGSVVTILLICTGMALLFFRSKKKNSSFENMVGEVSDTLKKIDIVNYSSPSLTKILFLSAITGMGLGLLGKLKSHVKIHK